MEEVKASIKLVELPMEVMEVVDFPPNFLWKLPHVHGSFHGRNGSFHRSSGSLHG